MTRAPRGILRTPEHPGRPTFLELFFDLVFVFAFAAVSQTLARDLGDARRSTSSILVAASTTLLTPLAMLMLSPTPRPAP